MKNFSSLYIIFTLVLGFACTNNTGENDGTSSTDEMVVEASINELQENPEEYVGKKVSIEGIVTHVCRHEGQKMFITSTNPDEKIKITAGEDDTGFNLELEGQTVKVTGILKELRIDENYINNMETDIIEECAHEQKQLSEEEKTKLEGMDRVAALRVELEESEKGYLSNLWIENIDYKVLENQ